MFIVDSYRRSDIDGITLTDMCSTVVALAQVYVETSTDPWLAQGELILWE